MAVPRGAYAALACRTYNLPNQARSNIAGSSYTSSLFSTKLGAYEYLLESTVVGS